MQGLLPEQNASLVVDNAAFTVPYRFYPIKFDCVLKYRVFTRLLNISVVKQIWIYGYFSKNIPKMGDPYRKSRAGLPIANLSRPAWPSCGAS
jgi:hypothetical protein